MINMDIMLKDDHYFQSQSAEDVYMEFLSFCKDGSCRMTKMNLIKIRILHDHKTL